MDLKMNYGYTAAQRHGYSFITILPFLSSGSPPLSAENDKCKVRGTGT